MTREPAGSHGPDQPHEPDQLGELLRHGLGRLADETPRYVDTAELRETVVARAHSDRASKRMMATAAALVPLAAAAGWVIGNAGGSGTVDGGDLGASTPGVVVATASASPTPTPTPSASATTRVQVQPGTPGPGSSPGRGSSRPTPPVASSLPTVPTVPTLPTTSATASATTSPTPTATPDGDPLVVQLTVSSNGRTAAGAYRAHYTVTFSGGDRAPVTVLLYQGSKILSRQDLGVACSGPSFDDDASGDVTLPGPGPYLFTGVVKAGCAGQEDRETDQVRWTWKESGPTSTPTPTPTDQPSPTPTPTGGATAPATPSATPTSSSALDPTPDASLRGSGSKAGRPLDGSLGGAPGATPAATPGTTADPVR
ncbi:hypothetical protein CLV35_3410 [Motilibacter peucedani]|uniref:Uncharacterized protein n=1 Tax=Motilibacter peucedani TaxID=598650 RepID=A0A420XLC3_9ACTN|nr:hypothetical protein [Motilibacter peucedani]RKS69235.1 hypothetical protein CLV35_3410 [Motilibacter peucedani]